MDAAGDAVARARVRRRAGRRCGVLRRAGVGALLLAPGSKRARPAAGMQAASAIGAWSLALAWLLTPSTELDARLDRRGALAGHHWLVAFAGTFLVLLPATAPMGATLVALERVLVPARQPGAIAALYAANTFGAVLGVLGSAFVLVPRVGSDGHGGALRGAEFARALPSRCGCSSRPRRRWRTARAHRLCVTAATTASAPRRRVAARGDRIARHRLRGARRARAEPGRREHRLHVRDPARRLSVGTALAPPLTAGDSRGRRSRRPSPSSSLVCCSRRRACSAPCRSRAVRRPRPGSSSLSPPSYRWRSPPRRRSRPRRSCRRRS